jgi:hypothetical protein
MVQESGLGGLQTKPGEQPHRASGPVSCGVTGAEFVGAGQVTTDSVTVLVFPRPVTVCVGPTTVIIWVTILVTGGRTEVIVVPLSVIVKVVPGRTVGVVTVMMLIEVVVIGGITNVVSLVICD